MAHRAEPPRSKSANTIAAENAVRIGIEYLRACRSLGPLVMRRLTSETANIPNLEAYRSVAEASGFEVRVDSARTRRGYEHYLILQRTDHLPGGASA